MQAVELLAHTPCGSGPTPTSSTPIGLVSPYAGVAAPVGWLICDGTAYDQTLYPDLFLAIGSTYNNASGQPSPAAGFFRVPDLRSRVPIGVGTGIGRVARTLASSGGQETRQIASANLPTHQHAIDHDHPNTTSTGDSVNHTHGGTTADINQNHTHGIGFSFFAHAGGGVVTARPDGGNPLTYNSLTVSSGHNHNFGTGGHSTAHTHNTDIPNFVGNSGNGGFANTAIDIMNPTLGLNYIIKA
jgi:microcystin-dependent protein